MKLISTSGAKNNFLIRNTTEIFNSYYFTYAGDATITFFPKTGYINSYLATIEELSNPEIEDILDRFNGFEEVYFKKVENSLVYCWSKPEPDSLYTIYSDDEILTIPKLCDVNPLSFVKKFQPFLLWDDATYFVGQANENVALLSPVMGIQELPYGIDSWERLAVYIAANNLLKDSKPEEVFEGYRKFSASQFPKEEYELIRRFVNV